MTRLTWDDLGDRVYETGLDRGVLYLPNGNGVPWNGLTSVTEKFDAFVSPVYYEGRKLVDLVTLGDFSGTLKAITYPDEFVLLQGYDLIRPGSFITDQYINTFGLSYRTLVGNDLNEDAGYKLHLVYNLTAVPSDQSHSSLVDSPSMEEFEWSITAIPEEIQGYRPTAHVMFDSRFTNPFMLGELENKLYGSDTSTASLIPIEDLVAFVVAWHLIDIVDHGDGTFTASSAETGYVEVSPDPTIYVINDPNITYVDADSYLISDSDYP